MARRRQAIDVSASLDQLRADFRMGQDSRFQSRLTGVAATGSGADWHLDSERHWLHMLERARHYRREDQVVGQGIRRVVANVVQEGFVLDPQTGSDELNDHLKKEWLDWSQDCDRCHSEQELTFAQMERMVLDAVWVDGDLIVLPLANGRLQFVEAHRLRTPRNTTRNVIQGVLVNEAKTRLEYWISKHDVSTRTSLAKVSEITAYAARNAEGHRQVLHLYDPYRFSQTRGVSVLAPISFTVGAFDDVQFASLVKQQIGALIAIMRERGADWSPTGGAGDYGNATTEESAGYTRRIDGLQAGMEVAGERGEKLSLFSANVPGPNFKEHSLLLLTFVAINLDLPLAVLLLDPSETNFSGWRGAIDQARNRFRQIQQWLADSFHSPVYEWLVRRWIATNPITARLASAKGLNPLAHRWNRPGWAYIEPLKDAAADELQHTRYLTSMRRIQNGRARDWQEVSQEIVDDNGLLIERAITKAQQLTERTGVEISWREVLQLPQSIDLSGKLPLEEVPSDKGQVARK